jgi:FKBP-type peptidyl-prolyl cis-trans isomerase (trigger factor)
MLEQILTRAVATAVQLDIPEAEVHELIERLFERYGATIRRQEHE